jgi:hypothetical protein
MKQLAQVNILYGNGVSGFKFQDPNTLVGALVSRILLFAIIGAGLIFFIRLLFAGFGFMTSGGDQAKIQSATKTITNSAIGLILVFCTYFIAQMLELLFNFRIL